MSDFLAFARGPLFMATFLFMVLGLGRHAVLRTRDLLRVRRRTPKRDVPWRAIVTRSAGWLVPVKHLFSAAPVMTISSILLHVGLIVVPIFCMGHVYLWSRSIGVTLPALGAGTADFLTLMALAAGLVLLFYRVAVRTSRDLSRPQDYLLLLSVLVPFASGYFAVHPESAPFTYQTVMLIHVLSANLLFILIPVTKLSHVVLFFFDQASGDIFWRLVPGAGARVAEELRGEPKGAEL